MKSYTFSVEKGPSIICEADCTVVIKPNDSGSVMVEVDGPKEFLEQCSVIQDSNTITINANLKRSYEECTFTGTNIVTDLNTVMVNGRIINLKNLGTGDEAAGKEPEPRVTIYSPISDFDGTFSLASSLESTQHLSNVYISASGTFNANIISVMELDCNLCGNSKLLTYVRGGGAEVNLSGTAQVNLSGNFSRIHASISGMGEATTKGECLGDYRVDVSDKGSITHIGTVMGNVRKNVSGMGSASI